MKWLMLADIETPATAFLKAGLLGAAIVVLAGVVLYLYTDAKKERDAFITKVIDIQTKRVEDAQKVSSDAVEALTAVGNSTQAQATTNSDVARALKNLEDEIRRCRK